MSRDVNLIVIHCTDTPDSMDVCIEDVRDWHIDRGWSDVGYHGLIKRDGMYEVGRDDETVGAHVHGYNKNSIGICLVGRYDFDASQYATLKATLVAYKAKYPKARIVGHYELDVKKTCPNINMPALMREWGYTNADLLEE